ncbi:hypothetical protein LLG95_14695 [bacterium]|nr:hypothetical protein [bacterium]
MKSIAVLGILIVFAFGAHTSYALAEMPRAGDELTTLTELRRKIGSYSLNSGESLMIENVMATFQQVDSNRGRLTARDDLGTAEFLFPVGTGNIWIYYPPVSFNIQNSGASISINAYDHPQYMYISGATNEFHMFITPQFPRYVNNEKWAISSETKGYANDLKFRTLTISDRKGNVKASFPVTESEVKYGRYAITIKGYDQNTNTAALRIVANEDPTMKGRWAFVQLPTYDLFQNTKEMFDTVSRIAGIKVVWEPAPGHPESVDYIKTYKNPNYSPYGERQTRELAFYYIKNEARRYPIQCEWVSDTVVKVSPRDYDQVVARQEEAKKFQDEQDAIRKKFDTDYQLATKVYFIQNMEPATAAELINRELHKYYLIRSNGELKIMRDDDEPYYNQAVVKWVQENSLFDNKTKAVIVKALPATQEKVATVLKQINAALYVPDADAMNVFQVEAILLRGNGDGAAALPPYLTAKDLEALGVKKVTEIGRAIVQLAGEKGELGDASVNLGGGYGVDLSFQDYRRPYLVLRGTLLSGVGAPKQAPVETPVRSEIKQTTVTLKRGEEKEFDGAVFRMLRAYARDPQDPKLDQVQIAINYHRETLKESINELESMMILDEFEITAEEITAAPGNKGDGTVKLRIRHIPPPRRAQPAKGEKEPGKAQLLENTVFLERDKPTLLGLTNMREALILVLRWKEK